MAEPIDAEPIDAEPVDVEPTDSVSTDPEPPDSELVDDASSPNRALADILAAQAGVVSRPQLRAAGVHDETVRMHLRAGRWQRVHPGVYVSFTGPLPRPAQLWAALLYAGPGATLSHETAAEHWGISDAPAPVVHVTIPVDRRVKSLAAVRIHYAHRLEQSRHPAQQPPVTQVDDTVLDLVDQATEYREVVSWVTRACQRRLTTPDRLGQAVDGRAKIRWRRELGALLSDVGDGAETPLELEYVSRVERPHGLPVGTRQRHRRVGRRSQWTDVAYDDYELLVELDGRVGHEDDGAFRDRARDNAATERGFSTLRYGWTDVVVNSCLSARQVAEVLWRKGWSGPLRKCGPHCKLGL